MKCQSLAGLLLLTLPMFFQLVPARAAPLSINEVQSGLLAQDSLTSGNTAYWYFYGDAVLTGAPHAYNEDSQGLHIGIQANKAGTWIGFFAESPNTAGQLFHAVLTLPYSKISSNEFNTGLYVQTSTDHINYVTCAAQADSTGYYWSVVYTRGNAQSARQYFTVFSHPGGPTVPLTRDCTIITNGSNQMKVYLDGQLVYSSSNLNLQMPSPFNSYLEVQSTYAGGMLSAKYNDYYATISSDVQVQNAPPGDTAQVIDSKGNVLASATVGSGGVALLDVGQTHLPITGYVQIYDTAHNLVATTGGTGAIWGGDVYRVGTTTTTTSVTSSSATTTTSSSTTLTSTTTASSTTSAASSSVTSTSTSTMPSSTTSTATTTTATTTTPTTTSSTTISVTSSSTTFTSTTTASSSVATPKLTVSTQDRYGSPLTGYYTELYLNGKKAADGYTPATYTLNNGQAYTIESDGYGSCPFDHWLDTGSTNNQRGITLTADTTLRAVLNCGTTTTTATTSTTTATTTTISTSTSTTTTATITTSSTTTGTVTTTTTSGGGTSRMTINAQDTNGAPLTGYYTALYQNNQKLATGYTPAVYTLNNGQTYTVEADGYGTCVWYQWLDTGSANNLRDITLTADATLTAVLKCGP